MPKQSTYRQGFTILEAIISLIVLVSLMSLGASYMKSSADKALNQNAAKNYVKDNYSMVNEYIANGLEYSILLDNSNNELTSNNYLSKNTALTNSYGQKYKIVVNQESESLMRIIVLTIGGEIMEEGAMMQTSAILGGDAGYISKLKNDQITGSQLAWDIPLITDARAGHLATVNYLTEKDVVNANDFLRRTKTAGHDEWNTMETDI